MEKKLEYLGLLQWIENEDYLIMQDIANDDSMSLDYIAILEYWDWLCNLYNSVLYSLAKLGYSLD
mgnify:CR=1 FL=1